KIMFKSNNQPGLFHFEMDLCKQQQDALVNSKEKWFYNLIFRNIDEDNFRALYSPKASRPNVAVNILVSALILKELKGISFDELMESVMFDLRTKVALGLESIHEVPFSRATLFNFQNRILEHELVTGINLIEQVFDSLTAQQLKQLSIKTDIQRTDSTLISSNIKKYSRIQLLVEVLIRLDRILKETDKQQIGEQLQAYLKTGSGKYVYGLKSEELPRELKQLGKVYYAVHAQISGKDQYKAKNEYAIFERVYQEHFIVVDQGIRLKPSSELHSGILQSPDDQDATFRKKKEQQSKGYTINGTETANPENPIQLITDIAVNPNNIDDTRILNERIDKIVEKTPDLHELHTDGGYGSEDNDKQLEALKITQITTAVRGRESEIEKKIEQISESPVIYTVECSGGQKIESTPTKQRYKVRFDTSICKECPLKEQCQIFKDKGRFYFGHENYLLDKRNRNIKNIPEERRKLRPNVESLMNEFKIRTPNGKTKVRGKFKTSLFAFNAGIAINFGRIFRYICKYELFDDIISQIGHFCNQNVLDFRFLRSEIIKFNIQKLIFEIRHHHGKYYTNFQTIAA
ncbi:MAG TPA: transposase, partial [Mariniphaga anaerophila]|nr:transposase [Mariniphaga anaerophila]